MATRTWKHAERSIARLIGCVRHPVNGRGDEPDLSNNWLAAEVKHRAQLPAWIHSAMRQAERSADGRLPIVVLHEAGQHYGESYVLLRLRAFSDYFGGDTAHED